MKTVLLAILLLAVASLAMAQTPPYDYPRTVGTSSAQVVAANPARKRLWFHNPNATAKIAVCPALSRVNSAAIACTINGAGSVTILPYGTLPLEGVQGQNASIPSAWNAISDTGGAALTVLEWE